MNVIKYCFISRNLIQSVFSSKREHNLNICLFQNAVNDRCQIWLNFKFFWIMLIMVSDSIEQLSNKGDFRLCVWICFEERHKQKWIRSTPMKSVDISARIEKCFALSITPATSVRGDGWWAGVRQCRPGAFFFFATLRPFQMCCESEI